MKTLVETKVSDKLRIILDPVSEFPIQLTTQFKDTESLFVVQLNKSEATLVLKALAIMIEEL